MKSQSKKHPSEIDFHAYLDGELSQPERDRFEAHIHQCDSCQRSLANTEELFHQIEGLPTQEFSIDLSTAVVNEINQHRRFEPFILRTTWAQGIATVALIAAIFYFLSVTGFQNQMIAGLNTFILDASYSLDTIAAAFWAQFQDMLLIDYSQLLRWEFPSTQLINTNLLIALSISSGLLWVVGNRLLLPKLSIRHSANGG